MVVISIYDLVEEIDHIKDIVIEFDFNEQINILLKSLYHGFNITDDNGAPFIITQEAPDDYDEIQKLFYYRHLGLC